jgi:hypothetical protein
MTEKLTPPPPTVGDEENTANNPVPEDEINLLELLYVLVKYKTVIIIFSVLGFAGGHFAAKQKGPVYTANAVLVAKEAEGARSSNLSSALGAFGGFGLAGGLNMMGNPGIGKLELYLGSREFNAELIEKYDLLPEMFKFAPKRQTSKVYEQYYDTINGKWLESFTLPTPVQMAGFLMGAYIKNETDAKKGILTVSVKSRDSTFSYKVLSNCIEHLDYYIKRDVQNDAKNNVDYLESQLFTIADPLLREKIQGMIASEIEKAMVVSREAFKVIDKPFCQVGFKEKRLYPTAGALGMFFMACALVIFFHQIFGAGNTNPESKRWADMIKGQLLKI